jgi:small subunit ribosomal protein S1
MESELESHLPLDESYWHALLNDVEALALDPTRDGRPRPAADSPRLGSPDAQWRSVQDTYESSGVIEVQSVGCNRGGLLIDWNGLRGFMPASHVCGLPPHVDEDSRRAELARRIGQSIRAKVIEFDRDQGRFVVSQRAACPDEDPVEMLWSQLAENQIRLGTVTNVCTFGAFVDLGGVEGLLHISEISWGRVNHPGDLLRSGQQVRVQILSVDRAQKRAALSMKRLKPDPWETVSQRYSVGQIVEGSVTGVVSFGAFTRLEDGLEGLVHISELAEGNFLHPHNVVHEGQTVRVRILSIDGPHRRLGLSLRQANGAAHSTGELPMTADRGAQEYGS